LRRDDDACGSGTGAPPLNNPSPGTAFVRCHIGFGPRLRRHPNRPNAPSAEPNSGRAPRSGVSKAVPMTVSPERVANPEAPVASTICMVPAPATSFSSPGGPSKSSDPGVAPPKSKDSVVAVAARSDPMIAGVLPLELICPPAPVVVMRSNAVMSVVVNAPRAPSVVTAPVVVNPSAVSVTE
jgi:hypothetical protein